MFVRQLKKYEANEALLSQKSRKNSKSKTNKKLFSHPCPQNTYTRKFTFFACQKTQYEAIMPTYQRQNFLSRKKVEKKRNS